jgi:uncharacterized membrane protein
MWVSPLRGRLQPLPLASPGRPWDADAQMPDLIAIAYAEETTADQAAEELGRGADDLPIDPDAIGVIVCERDGSCRLITSRHPGATAAWSKFWGRLLSIAMNEFATSGIDPAFREQIRAALTPGTSILFVVVGRERAERAVEAVSQYGGRPLRCALSKAELRDALNGEHAQI